MGLYSHFLHRYWETNPKNRKFNFLGGDFTNKLPIKECIKYTLLLMFAGFTYVSLEVIFRGRSDVTMMYCGAICAIPMLVLNNFFTYEMDFGLQVLISALFATGNEWVTGLLVNQDYHIWDYRNVPLHSPDGQICVPFMLLWALIAIIVIPLMDYIDWKLFNYMPYIPPYYKVFGKKIFQFKNK